jgi:hypothetical protein
MFQSSWVSTWGRVQWRHHSAGQHLKHRDGCPQQGVKVFPVAHTGVGVAELAAEQVHAKDAEDEDEEHEEAEKDSDVVHSPEHHDELPPEVGQKANQLQYSQQPECPV